jgi:hypothetical protein
LKEDGYFSEMADGYRFAIALAIAHGAIAPPPVGGRQTIFNLGTLDQDGTITAAVRALRERSDEPVHRTLERLAEWGVEELYRRVEEGHLSFAEILAEAEGLTGERPRL